MKATHLLISLGYFSLCGALNAQELPVQKLEEVVVSDSRLADFGEGHKSEKLKDSTIQRNGPLLTSLLAFNSNIYFKENGYGMVSSPAFRGTNASHTAVVWNGININSPLTGQLDFNTVTPFNYDDLVVRSGGSSVLYGTGAIGGSIHLNNQLRFQEHFENRLMTGYGSFDTRSLNFKQDFGTKKWAYSLGVNTIVSDNDYRFIETGDRNENAAFEQWGINFSAGHRLGASSLLKLYHQTQIGDRNLSGTLVAPGRSRYKDDRHQTQLHYQLGHGKTTSQVRIAHLYEQYRFFENKENPGFSFGKVNTLLARYQMDTELTPKIKLNTALQFTNLEGRGSNLGGVSRNDFSTILIAKHRLSEKFVYNLNARKDFITDFNAPWVYGFDFAYSLTPKYSLKLNASRNFRVPTFNDLYWQPGGNLDLVTETSYQLDLGQQFRFGNMQFLLNGYYIDTQDMIRWLPSTNGIWSPVNVDSVTIYGLEGEMDFSKEIGKQQSVELNLNYAYTVSKDDSTNEQLIYVPFHRGTGSVAYRFGVFRAFYQHLYNGAVSIIGGELEDYQVTNVGLEYQSKSKNRWSYSLGFTLNNLFNAYYENVALRPMPNRNLQTYLILNF